ncbi:hypothetical protein C4901_16575 [Acidiferrobacter sp. SPIII_3]|nr:MFS transporter [Acidiferrobacter sp. SPIII_3]AWP24738.1 hypothetical protein C4901_16575 [Acidiferrobacter sp. SPIII_3]
MAKIWDHLRSGDWRSLVASFLYFDTGFTVWLLFGPLAPYMGPHLHLAPAAMGFLVAVPVLSGALLRVPLGHLYQTLDGRTIALMGIMLSALTPLYLLFAAVAPTFGVLLVLGVLLGAARGAQSGLRGGCLSGAGSRKTLSASAAACNHTRERSDHGRQRLSPQGAGPGVGACRGR